MLSLDRQNALRARYHALRPQWQPANQHYANLIRKWLRPHGQLLDIGCGRGGAVEQLSHPLEKVFGVDPDWQSLYEHRLAIQRAQALTQLPFAASSFDVVLASWLLEHWQHPLAELREIRRVLRPGGVLIFLTPNRYHPLIRLNQILSRLQSIQRWLVNRLYARDATDTFPAFYRANDPAKLQQLATAAELTICELTLITDPTYVAFADALLPLSIYLEERLPMQHRLHIVGVMRRD